MLLNISTAEPTSSCRHRCPARHPQYPPSITLKFSWLLRPLHSKMDERPSPRLSSSMSRLSATQASPQHERNKTKCTRYPTLPTMWQGLAVRRNEWLTATGGDRGPAFGGEGGGTGAPPSGACPSQGRQRATIGRHETRGSTAGIWEGSPAWRQCGGGGDNGPTFGRGRRCCNGNAVWLNLRLA